MLFAIFIILYVDLQLRAGTGAPHARRSPAVRARSSRHAQTAAGGPGPQLSLEQVFIAVKTTGRFHGTRLALLLQTWISRTKAQVSARFPQVAGTENHSSVRARARARGYFKSVDCESSSDSLGTVVRRLQPLVVVLG